MRCSSTYIRQLYPGERVRPGSSFIANQRRTLIIIIIALDPPILLRAPISILPLLDPPSPISDLKINTHAQDPALQTPRDGINPPRAPPSDAQPLRQTASPHKTARRLDAHGRDAQTARGLQAPCGEELRDELDAGEQRGEDAERVGPRLEVLRDEVEDQSAHE